MDVLRTLIKHGAPYTKHLQDVLRDGKPDHLDLIRRGNPDHLWKLKLLLKAGVSVDKRMNVSKTLKALPNIAIAATASSIVLKGFTPLLFAIVHESYEHALLLLDHGASAMARTSSMGDDEASSDDSESDNDGGPPPVKMGRFSALHLVALTINGSLVKVEQAIRLSQKLIDNGLKLTKKDSSNKTGTNPSSQSIYQSIPPIYPLITHTFMFVTPKALHYVAASGNVPLLEMIVKNTKKMSHPGAVIDARQDDTNETPFHSAVLHGETESAHALAIAGADVDAHFNVSSSGAHHGGHYTALTYAASHGLTAMVECLIDRCAADASLLSPLRSALTKGHTQTVLALIDRASELEEDDFDEPLHIAACHGHTHTARALLKLGVAVDAASDRGKTALMMCAERGDTNTALLLLENAATLRATDVNGSTSLHYCCRFEDEDPGGWCNSPPTLYFIQMD